MNATVLFDYKIISDLHLNICAVGPFSTELSGPEMPIDANGEVNATFLCKGLYVNPDPNITWFRRPSGVVINRGATYSFPPTKDDDGAVIECETKNTITSTTTRERITVVLNCKCYHTG